MFGNNRLHAENDDLSWSACEQSAAHMHNQNDPLGDLLDEKDLCRDAEMDLDGGLLSPGVSADSFIEIDMQASDVLGEPSSSLHEPTQIPQAMADELAMPQM